MKNTLSEIAFDVPFAEIEAVEVRSRRPIYLAGMPIVELRITLKCEDGIAMAATGFLAAKARRLGLAMKARVRAG